MSKRFPNAKWVLPETVDPAERLCFTIQVPNDPQHIAAFRGCLYNLTSARFWQDDEAHTAKEVAAVWAEIYDQVEACIMAVTDVRQNEEEPCILEKQIDEGEFVEFANLQLCPPRIRSSNGRLQFFDGSEWIDLPGQGEETVDGEDTPPWPDPPPGEEGNCLAAENIVAMLEQQVLEWTNALTAGAIALTILTIISTVLIAFFLPFSTPAVLGFAASIIGIGAGGLDAAFTEEVYERFKCIIYFNISADGAVSVAEYDDIIEAVQAESGTAWDLIEIWIGFFGPVGLTRAGAAAGITEGACDECWDFTLTPGTTGTLSAVHVNYDEEFTFTFTAQTGSWWNYNGDFTISPCGEVVIVSVTNHTPGGIPSAPNWNYHLCGSGTNHLNHGNPTLPASDIEFCGGNSLTQTVIVMKVIP